MIRETTERVMDEGRGTVAAPHRAARPSLEQGGTLSLPSDAPCVPLRRTPFLPFP